ncbi:MAG TPA: glycosyltransferase family 39 protein [Polyangiaceae bacterium]|nr:glycosyltransferase family 39 protein [Polyangiaceae bacterium]
MKARAEKSYAADHLIGFLLAIGYLVILVKTAHGIGYARDEGFYFRAASAYADWFERLMTDWKAATQQAVVDGYWSNNHEHPGLVKMLFGLSWHYLHRKVPLFAEEGTSFRFGGMCFAAASLWLIHIWGARARSRSAGLVAALAFALMPRIFYHAHLDCFDVPIAFMWTFCAYAYWRSLARPGLKWAIVTGVAFGLALDTKHNSWFLPPAFVVHTLLSRGASFGRGLGRGQIRVPLSLVAMATLGPLVFFAAWPWIWFDTIDRLNGYASFHLHHDYYNIVYLGQTYWKPPMPRSYVWVMTAATVPTITLVLFVTGMASRLRAHAGRLFSKSAKRPFDPGSTDLLWAIGIGIQYAPWILSTSTPIFGGTKHWFTAYPFLCLFAGAGFEVVFERVRELLRTSRLSVLPGWALETLLGFAVLSAPLAETIHSHPWGLSNYTPLVGGAPGAASLGLNRQFWGFTTGAVTDWLNEHATLGRSVFIHDTAYDSWEMLRRDGRLAPHVQAAGPYVQGSSIALYQHEEHMETIEYQIWTVYGTASPAYVGAYDGVPIIYVYEQAPK